jgi:hypothetical protein
MAMLPLSWPGRHAPLPPGLFRRLASFVVVAELACHVVEPLGNPAASRVLAATERDNAQAEAFGLPPGVAFPSQCLADGFPRIDGILAELAGGHLWKWRLALDGLLSGAKVGLHLGSRHVGFESDFPAGCEESAEGFHCCATAPSYLNRFQQDASAPFLAPLVQRGQVDRFAVSSREALQLRRISKADWLLNERVDGHRNLTVSRLFSNPGVSKQRSLILGNGGQQG